MILAAVIFALGYLLIALEHQVKIDKAATALVLGVVIWLTVAFSMGDMHSTLHSLGEHFEEIAEISKKHAMEMFGKGDEAHLKAMNEMQSLMKSPEAMQAWFSGKKNEFNAL